MDCVCANVLMSLLPQETDESTKVDFRAPDFHVFV